MTELERLEKEYWDAAYAWAAASGIWDAGAGSATYNAYFKWQKELKRKTL